MPQSSENSEEAPVNTDLPWYHEFTREEIQLWGMLAAQCSSRIIGVRFNPHLGREVLWTEADEEAMTYYSDSEEEDEYYESDEEERYYESDEEELHFESDEQVQYFGSHEQEQEFLELFRPKTERKGAYLRQDQMTEKKRKEERGEHNQEPSTKRARRS